jgi:hypothetical protein
LSNGYGAWVLAQSRAENRDIQSAAVVDIEYEVGGVQLTPRSCSASSRCRGITVTSSISQRNATSGGVKPGGRGNAIVFCGTLVVVGGRDWERCRRDGKLLKMVWWGCGDVPSILKISHGQATVLNTMMQSS